MMPLLANCSRIFSRPASTPVSVVGGLDDVGHQRRRDCRPAPGGPGAARQAAAPAAGPSQLAALGTRRGRRRHVGHRGVGAEVQAGSVRVVHEPDDGISAFRLQHHRGDMGRLVGGDGLKRRVPGLRHPPRARAVEGPARPPARLRPARRRPTARRTGASSTPRRRPAAAPPGGGRWGCSRASTPSVKPEKSAASAWASNCRRRASPTARSAASRPRQPGQLSRWASSATRAAGESSPSRCADSCWTVVQCASAMLFPGSTSRRGHPALYSLPGPPFPWPLVPGASAR